MLLEHPRLGRHEVDAGLAHLAQRVGRAAEVTVLAGDRR